MKKPVIAIAMLGCTLLLSAQDNYFSLNMGMALPFGNMGLTEDVSTDGYALNGFSLNFDGAYFPWANLGIGGMLSFTSNYGETEKYQDGMDVYLFSTGVLAYPVPESAERSLTSGFWNTIMLFAGPTLNVPLNRFQIDLRAFGGTGAVLVPTREYMVDYDFTSITSKTQQTNLRFAYLLGGGLKYEMSAGYALKLSADYLVTKSKYNLNNQGTVSSTDLEFPEQEIELNMPLLSVTLGLCYLF